MPIPKVTVSALSIDVDYDDLSIEIAMSDVVDEDFVRTVVADISGEYAVGDQVIADNPRLFKDLQLALIQANALIADIEKAVRRPLQEIVKACEDRSS